jgi:alpha-beta hydrolase superfamily lysophospholipase
METKVQESKLAAGNGVELFVSKNIVKNPKAVIIIVHGICEHSGRYAYSTAKFNSWGCSVYRFDNRGHGRSGGDRGYIDDFNEFIDDTKRVVAMVKQENRSLPVFMLGHSLGGFITAAYGVKYPGRLSGQVLSGAASTLQPLLAGLEGVDFSATGRDPIANTLTDLISSDPEVVRDYKDDPLNLKEFTTKLMSEALIRGARWLMNNHSAYACPCLILHGGADQIVTPDASRYFFEHIASKDKELKIYDGLYHEIMNEPEKDTVLEDIHRWLEKRI